MASNRTMDMALGKLGKGMKTEEPNTEEDPDADASDEQDEGDHDEAKETFIDMCKAIKAGRYDEAYKLWGDCKELG